MKGSMIPAQTSDDVNKERNFEFPITSEPNGENWDSVEMTDDVLGLAGTNNGEEDNSVYAESLCDQKKVDETAYLEIDVLECGESAVVESIPAEELDATEHSSSFGDTFSGSGSGSKLNSSDEDEEVDSQFCDENMDSAVLGGLKRGFRKKQLTDHWRMFIHPLRWRCKWIELQMKELHSQALIYDKELAQYKNAKELQSEQVELDRSTCRLVPLACRSHRKQAMKRRKRKGNEDDASKYLSHHSIFSYYEKRSESAGLSVDDPWGNQENRRSDTDGLSVADQCGDQVTLGDRNMKDTDDLGADHECQMLAFRDVVCSLEQIVSDIEAVRSRVLKLKTNLNEVICRNTRERSSTSGVSLPGDPSTSSAMNFSCSPVKNGDAIPIGALTTPIGALTIPPHHITKHQIEDLVMLESPVSSYRDAAELNVFESIMDLLSGDESDDPLDQHQIGGLCNDIVDYFLVDNHAAEEELQSFRWTGQELETETYKESTTCKVSMPEPVPEAWKVDVLYEPVQKPCSPGSRDRKEDKRKQGEWITSFSSSRESERLQKRRLLERT